MIVRVAVHVGRGTRSSARTEPHPLQAGLTLSWLPRLSSLLPFSLPHFPTGFAFTLLALKCFSQGPHLREPRSGPWFSLWWEQATERERGMERLVTSLRDRLGIAADLSCATSALELATVPSSSKER